jgi:hypothetical protein
MAFCLTAPASPPSTGSLAYRAGAHVELGITDGIITDIEVIVYYPKIKTPEFPFENTLVTGLFLNNNLLAMQACKFDATKPEDELDISCQQYEPDIYGLAELVGFYQLLGLPAIKAAIMQAIPAEPSERISPNKIS